MTTTDDEAISELELDRLAWNLPAPPEEDTESARPWPPRPFGPVLEEDEESAEDERKL